MEFRAFMLTLTVNRPYDDNTTNYLIVVINRYKRYKTNEKAYPDHAYLAVHRF